MGLGAGGGGVSNLPGRGVRGLGQPPPRCRHGSAGAEVFFWGGGLWALCPPFPPQERAWLCFRSLGTLGGSPPPWEGLLPPPSPPRGAPQRRSRPPSLRLGKSLGVPTLPARCSHGKIPNPPFPPPRFVPPRLSPGPSCARCCSEDPPGHCQPPPGKAGGPLRGCGGVPGAAPGGRSCTGMVWGGRRALNWGDGLEQGTARWARRGGAGHCPCPLPTAGTALGTSPCHPLPSPGTRFGQDPSLPAHTPPFPPGPSMLPRVFVPSHFPAAFVGM